jgi:transcriptional regulator with XRE-family HTH domain
MTQRQLGIAVDASEAEISRYVTDRITPRADKARAIDGALSANGELVALWDAARDAGHLPWVDLQRQVDELRDNVTLLAEEVQRLRRALGRRGT